MREGNECTQRILSLKTRLPYEHNNNYEHNNEQFSFLTKHNQGFGNPSILDIFYLGTWY